MQATRALRVQASRVMRDGDARSHALLAQASPHLTKIWKSYAYTRNQRVQQLSPFENDILGPLFRNIAGKMKHKIEDNILDVAPPVIFFVGLVALVKYERKQILLHHRS